MFCFTRSDSFRLGFLKMPTFKDIAGYIKSFDLNKSLNRIFQASTVQKFVIDTIKRRLYDQGITGSELKLRTDKGNPFYTDAYVKVKKRIGEKTTNVTLFLKGGFYQSFRFILIDNGWRIEADWGFTAIHFKDLYASESDFQQDVMSLTETEINRMLDFQVNPEIIKDFHETIYKP